MKRTKSSGKKISVASISLNLYYRALSTHNNEMLNHMRLQELAEFREDIRLWSSIVIKMLLITHITPWSSRPVWPIFLLRNNKLAFTVFHLKPDLMIDMDQLGNADRALQRTGWQFLRSSRERNLYQPSLEWELVINLVVQRRLKSIEGPLWVQLTTGSQKWWQLRSIKIVSKTSKSSPSQTGYPCRSSPWPTILPVGTLLKEGVSIITNWDPTQCVEVPVCSTRAMQLQSRHRVATTIWHSPSIVITIRL